MVVLWRLLLVLLGLRRVEMRLPLRPGTTAAYFLCSCDRDAARKCPQLIRNANLLWLHPFILLGVRSWALFPVRRMSMPTATTGDLAEKT